MACVKQPLSVVLVGVLVTVFLTPDVVLAASPTIYADGVLAYTNVERYRNGLPFLESDPALSQAAQRKLADLFARQYFAHEAPTGESVADLVRDAGYEYLAVGENLALGNFTSNKHVVDAWMDSPGHRANILSDSYTEIGIAAGLGIYEGKRTWIVVQSFGLPRTACPRLDTDLRARLTSLKQTLDILHKVAELRETLLEDENVSASLYNARVVSYNVAAQLYNERAAEYRGLIDTYNQSVGDVNTCITERTLSKH